MYQSSKTTDFFFVKKIADFDKMNGFIRDYLVSFFLKVLKLFKTFQKILKDFFFLKKKVKLKDVDGLEWRTLFSLKKKYYV